MKPDFPARWRNLAQRARRVEPDIPPPSPFLVRRLLARTGAPPDDTGDDWWFRVALRSLAGAAALVLLLAFLELPHWRTRATLDPGIENTVAQLLWSL